jgi:tRNA(Ile2) C34 agmatinyltransferase TiaS
MVSCSMTLDISELARQLAARRRPKRVICPVCGTETVGLGRRKYCGDRCAKLAWWRRHRSKASEPAMDEAALRAREDDGGSGEADR